MVLVTALMIQGGQTVSAPLFWALALGPAVAAVWAVAVRVKPLALGWGWKLQRLTAAGLLVLIPAHFLFTHLNPAMGHDWSVVHDRLSNGFILALDVVILLSTLYHAGYGVISLFRDYLPAGFGFRALKALVIVLCLLAAFVGLRILWFC